MYYFSTLYMLFATCFINSEIAIIHSGAYPDTKFRKKIATKINRLLGDSDDESSDDDSIDVEKKSKLAISFKGYSIPIKITTVVRTLAYLFLILIKQFV